MKRNFHKSCGNCIHYLRMRHVIKRCKKIQCKTNYHCGASKIIAWDFGGLCLLFDARGTPQYQAPHYWCKMWKGIKYDKIKERHKMKEMLKGRT